MFREGKFDWMSLKFNTDNFDAVLKTAQQAYGEPCAVDSRPLQNAFGAQFSGDEVRWCFDTGNLTVRRHAERDYHFGEFDYFERRPEDGKPTEPVTENSI